MSEPVLSLEVPLLPESVRQPLEVLSLGAGVQSSTAALKAAFGELVPMPIGAIFADTKAEPKSVYLWLDWLEKQLPFPVYRVTHGNLEEDTLRERVRQDGKGTWVPSGIPHYSINSDGSKGHGPRQCTHDFKLLPILTKQRELVGREAFTVWRRVHKAALAELTVWTKQMAEWRRRKKRGIKEPAPMRPEKAWAECQADPLVRVWIGISADEASRVKESKFPWIKHYYPLFEAGTTRNDCLLWMAAHGFPRPPRSACVFCPYHSNEEWRRLKREEPEEFARACRFDVAYRTAKIRTVKHKGFVPYLHDSRKPLAEVDFDTEEDKGQLNLFNNECQGMCGV